MIHVCHGYTACLSPRLLSNIGYMNYNSHFASASPCISRSLSPRRSACTTPLLCHILALQMRFYILAWLSLSDRRCICKSVSHYAKSHRSASASSSRSLSSRRKRHTARVHGSLHLHDKTLRICTS